MEVDRNKNETWFNEFWEFGDDSNILSLRE
jgi:hypothetical protein